MKSVTDAIRDRRSINFFDTSRAIPGEDLEKMLALASLSPSAVNMQPWEVYTIVTPEMKKALRPAAGNQPKIEEASAVFVVASDRDAPEKNAPVVADDMIRLGYFPESGKEGFIKGAIGGNGVKGTQARDNYSRTNAALFAMTLMLAGQGLGYETHPVGGFNEDAVKKVLNMPDNYMVVLMVTVGFLRPGIELLPRVYRRPPSEFNRFL